MLSKVAFDSHILRFEMEIKLPDVVMGSSRTDWSGFVVVDCCDGVRCPRDGSVCQYAAYGDRLRGRGKCSLSSLDSSK